MKNLLINSTQLTPKVTFDKEKNIFEISGESTPESAAEFYNPIIQWLKDYESILYFAKTEYGKVKNLKMTVKFDYFNSTSAKFILDIFLVLQKFKNEGYDTEIDWHYDSGDIDMKEAGEEFAGLCPNLIVNYISYN